MATEGDSGTSTVGDGMRDGDISAELAAARNGLRELVKELMDEVQASKDAGNREAARKSSQIVVIMEKMVFGPSGLFVRTVPTNERKKCVVGFPQETPSGWDALWPLG